jgi:hypothetical protein
MEVTMSKILHVCVGLPIGLLVALVVTLSAPQARAESPIAAPTTQPAVSFAGEWRTTFGTMMLSQTAEVIQGGYVYGNVHATLTGKLKGRRFTFTYAEPTAAGEGWFELAGNGQSFKGQWRENNSKGWSDWEGQLVAAADSFTGLWNTTYGRMRLRQTGDSVRGIYEFGDVSHISGTVANRVFHFHYEQPDGEKGEGDFTLAADGSGFAGPWKAAAIGKQSSATGGQWSATRILPNPDITWLVVLEAHWEHGLAEQEYSFGVMLRTFFARVPRVQVRHRFFGNEAEFRRWCGELPFLAEPVVLHISSHGTREGIQCGRQLLGADVLIDCLRDAGDLRLLHFGTCLVAGGDIPKKIFQSLGDAATFPISGYVNSADWGGSAVVDFTYLDLVLSRGMSPADAVRQTLKMLTFAREKGEPGDAISGAGLIFLDPRSVPATQPGSK